MTDIEMTKLTAEAIGFHVATGTGEQVWCHKCWPDPHDNKGIFLFDPLHDNAQAMALVKKFKLNIGQLSNACQVFTPLDAGHIYQADSADLNRAIVECVAKIAKG
jgi:hypothetical protein